MLPNLRPASDWHRLRIHFNRWGLTSKWPMGYQLKREWFNYVVIDFTLWFFFEGTGEVVNYQTGKTHRLYPGVCLCMKPGVDIEIRQLEPDPLGDSFFHIEFYEEARRLSLEEWPALPFYSEVSDIGFFDQTMRRILALLNQAHHSTQTESEEPWLAAELLVKGLLLDLVQSQNRPKLSGTMLHHDRVISATLSALFSDPLQFRSVTDLAEASGYSQGHFRALCYQITGETPAKLLIKARIEQAKKYLRHSDLTIGMIAEALGYEHIYYFSRQFKHATGLTASEYRKRCGESEE